MASQRTGSIEHATAIAADSPAISESLAARIPPELFKNILAYVGNEHGLGILYLRNPLPDPAARRKELRPLSACALTCVYWARLARQRMFNQLIIRSSEDMLHLLSLLRAPQSPRIPPIYDILQYLYVFYTLGDYPWFHNLTQLAANYRVLRLRHVFLHITGPARPAFVAASTRGSMLQPLFFAVRRNIPMAFRQFCDLFLYIQNIHLPRACTFANLVQDCLSLRPQSVACDTLTWDPDPALQATPSSVGLKYSGRMQDGYYNTISGCTDDVLVAAMLKSVPHYELSRRRQGPHLDPLETSYLFDAMRTTCRASSPELEQPEKFRIVSTSAMCMNPNHVPEEILVRLRTEKCFCLLWQTGYFAFRFIASLLPHAPANSNKYNITYIIIDLAEFGDHDQLRESMKTPGVDWDTFLHTVRQFPHLRQIAIQCDRVIGQFTAAPARPIIVEFLAHLRGAWFGLNELLGLYCKEWGEFEWVQLQLDTLMDEIEEARVNLTKDDTEEVELSIMLDKIKQMGKFEEFESLVSFLISATRELEADTIGESSAHNE